MKYSIFLLTLPVAVHCYNIVLQSYRHEINPDFVQNITVGLIKYNNVNVISGCIVYSQDIETFGLKLIAKVPRGLGNSWVWMNVSLNGCDLLGGPNRRPNIIQLIVKGIQATSPKFPKKCPIPKGSENCYSNFSFSAVKLPPYMPAVTFNFEMELHQKNVSIYKGYFVADVTGRP